MVRDGLDRRLADRGPAARCVADPTTGVLPYRSTMQVSLGPAPGTCASAPTRARALLPCFARRLDTVSLVWTRSVWVCASAELRMLTPTRRALTAIGLRRRRRSARWPVRRERSRFGTASCPITSAREVIRWRPVRHTARPALYRCDAAGCFTSGPFLTKGPALLCRLSCLWRSSSSRRCTSVSRDHGMERHGRGPSARARSGSASVPSRGEREGKYME